ncbi:MAG: hypothetical protein J7L07_12070, partial [Candidatus Odinarchaeota archaeon]|nr:hypothetical protein [Candidatus Odinarchaeota archaeon]
MVKEKSAEREIQTLIDLPPIHMYLVKEKGRTLCYTEIRSAECNELYEKIITIKEEITKLNKSSIAIPEVTIDNNNVLTLRYDIPPGYFPLTNLDDKQQNSLLNIFDMTIQVLDCLREAHKIGLYHGFLIKENIFVSINNSRVRVIILNFGIIQNIIHKLS